MYPNRRFIVLISSAVLQFSLGIPPLWGIFQPYVISEFGWSATACAITFPIANASFVLGNLFGGRMQDRISPRKVVFCSVVVAAAGLCLASLGGTDSPLFLYLTFGVLNGIGSGAASITSITCSQKWYFDRKGFATGMSSFSLAICGILLTPLCSFILRQFGVRNSLWMLGVGSLIIGLFCAVSIVPPPHQSSTGSRTKIQPMELTSGQMVKTQEYRILVGSMILMTPAFLLINPIIVTLSLQRGVSQNIAVYAVMFASVFNASGRLFSPILSDRIGRKCVILAVFALSMTACLLLFWAQGILTTICCCIVAFSYGSALSCFLALTTDLFGFQHAGQNYGLVFLGCGISAVTITLLSFTFKGLSDSRITFLFAALSMAAAILFLSLLKRKR
jgi:OFA family oxalate/formate antiporter-like MFS transporter